MAEYEYVFYDSHPDGKCLDCGEGVHLDYAGEDMGVLAGISVWVHDRWRSEMIDSHEPRVA